MSFHMISMMTTSVVFSLLLHLMWSECDAARADIVVSYERPKPSRRDCQYNGKTYRHGYYNDTNPECISYWCVNGDMDIARCSNETPRPYGSCVYVRRKGPFPYCCEYIRAC
uniref:8.9 kDa family member n=1 Tax=Rhipicephalus zambeziensis TaxID=60191 RepID=A0A224Y166_9ACAR